MATFRDLLNTLNNLSDAQLDQEIKIVPTGYCDEANVIYDGCSPFDGSFELAISQGDIVHQKAATAPGCWYSPEGCFDAGEVGDDSYDEEDVIIRPGMPYFKIGN